jgi:hypothetical protein
MRAWADVMGAGGDKFDPKYDAAADAAMYAFEDAIGDVLTVQPTTIAGVAALLEHVGQEEFLGMSSRGANDEYETVLTTWIAIGDGDERKQIAQEFPLRLAATLKRLIEVRS